MKIKDYAYKNNTIRDIFSNYLEKNHFCHFSSLLAKLGITKNQFSEVRRIYISVLEDNNYIFIKVKGYLKRVF